MRPVDSTTSERFLRAVHHRMAGVRAIERMGLCALIGCLAAIVLSAILLWQGRSAVTMTAGCAGLGLLTGLLWGIIRRPNEIEVAIEVDRQLDLADLLSTIVAIRDDRSDRTTDHWRRSIRAVADARCDRLTPDAVLLHRYGARAWGGIGLIAALAMTVAFVSTRPELIRADSVSTRASRVDSSRPSDSPSPTDRQGFASSVNPRHSREEERSDPEAFSDIRPDSTGDPDTAPLAGLDHDSTIGDGAGGQAPGGSRTDPVVNPRPASPSGSMPRSTHKLGDPAASGAGSAADPSSDRNPIENNGLSDGIANPDSTPWEASGWNRHRDAALRSVERGAIPPAYHDLVRDYFARE